MEKALEEQLCAVAIDGPAGAGKSTVAREVARCCGFVYVDTGAIYRTVGLAVWRSGLDPYAEEAVQALLPALEIHFGYDGQGVQHMYLQGEDVSGLIRTPEMSQYASAVSTLPCVRAFLLEMQRQIAREKKTVMDGRDIGTVVLPRAGLKIFLTASPQARAERRLAELQARGEDTTLEQVLAEMQARDAQDSSRSAAPLRAAEDAVVVDTTDLTLEQTVQTILSLVKSRFGPEKVS